MAWEIIFHAENIHCRRVFQKKYLIQWFFYSCFLNKSRMPPVNVKMKCQFSWGCSSHSFLILIMDRHFFFWITRKSKEDDICKSFQNFWTSMGESIVSSFQFFILSIDDLLRFTWSPKTACVPTPTGGAQGCEERASVCCDTCCYCIVDVSLPAMKFFPVLRERELFTRGCSADENGKPLMVIPCMSSSVVSPREKSHTPRLSTRQNHTSALHFQGTKREIWAHPRFPEKVPYWIVMKYFVMPLGQMSMPPKFLNFPKRHTRTHW